MKRITIALVIAGVAAVLGWAILQSPERRLCRRMAALCRTDGNYADVEVCLESVQALGRVFGEAAVTRAADCTEDAQGCAGGIACVAAVSSKTPIRRADEGGD